VLHAAETAYTAGDIPLAAKLYLMVVDMTDADQGDSPIDSVPDGITIRAWYGLKQCTRRILRDPKAATVSPSETSPLQNVHLVDELATERLLTAYSTGNGSVSGREVLVKWLENTS